MLFWLDAHLSPEIAHWLRDRHGLNAQSLIEMGLFALKDHEIFAKARDAGAVMLTKDSDFVELVTRLGPPPQIVLLACGNTSNAALRTLLGTALPRMIELLRSGERVVEVR